MTRTRLAVNESATPDPNEVLVTFDTGGILQNHLLRAAPTLRAQLLATPIGDPERAAIEADAFAAAEQELDAQPDPVIDEAQS